MRSILLTILAIFLTGCGTSQVPHADPPAAEYISSTVVGFLGNAYGQHQEALGLAVIEAKTGNVLFCNDDCKQIGKVAPAGAATISIHDAGDSHFYVANSLTGEIADCSITASYKGRIEFQSGTCKTVRPGSPASH
jgi:hypothetical protein